MVYILITDGFREIETLCPAYTLRSDGVDVTLVSVGSSKRTVGSVGIVVDTDTTLDEMSRTADADLVLFPLRPSDLPDEISESDNEPSPLLDRILEVFPTCKYVSSVTTAAQALKRLGLYLGETKRYYDSISSHEALQYLTRPTKPIRKSVENDNCKKWENGEKYLCPPTSLLAQTEQESRIAEKEATENGNKLLKKLQSLNLDVTLNTTTIGASYTRYEFISQNAKTLRRISSITKDLALELNNELITFQYKTVLGIPAVCIDVPHSKASVVSFRKIAESDKFRNAKSNISVILGETESGDPVVEDIHNLPHVFIAGTTKSGKTVSCVNMILSILMRSSPDDVKLMLIDTKRVEYTPFAKIPHLITPIIYDIHDAIAALNWAGTEIDRRLALMSQNKCRSLEDYKNKAEADPTMEKLPQLVIIADDVSDLMFSRRTDTEIAVCRLSAKGRAAGIYILTCTQRSDLFGLQNHFPARILFKTADSHDAFVAGIPGAEKLLGKGDMLFKSPAANAVRVQGAYTSSEDVKNVVDYIISNNGTTDFNSTANENIKTCIANYRFTPKNNRADDKLLLISALKVAMEYGNISTSMIQRTLSVGYSKASRLIDIMEEMGVVAPQNGSKPRKVLLTAEEINKLIESDGEEN